MTYAVHLPESVHPVHIFGIATLHSLTAVFGGMDNMINFI